MSHDKYLAKISDFHAKVYRETGKAPFSLWKYLKYKWGTDTWEEDTENLNKLKNKINKLMEEK